jgi:serine/threonine protein kinase
LPRRRRVVLKVQQPTDSPEAVERFRREAIALSLIDHPNVTTLYAYSDAEPRTMAIEYVPGRTLAERVAEKGPLEIEMVCRLVEEIAGALDCSHAWGILHRDVNPQHILMPDRGPARLIDFGSAKIVGEPQITLMGQKLGDDPYISPEQRRGEMQMDARADVYSLAAVAHFALTGAAPALEGGGTTARMARPDLPPDLDKIISGAMASNPGHRFHSAGQMAAALRIGLESCRTRYGLRLRRPISPWSVATAILGTAAVIVCGLALWLYHFGAVAPKHSDSLSHQSLSLTQIAATDLPSRHAAASDLPRVDHAH